MSRNAIIVGAGRSGTSMLAGLLHGSGYFSGDHLLPGTPSNPLGYFEDSEIQAINQDLLRKVTPWRPRGVIGAVLPVLRNRPKWGQLHLSDLPEGTTIRSDPGLDSRMAALTSRRPYLFKDTAFSYTLTAWLPHLADDTIFLCIFREPQRTVNSLLRFSSSELINLGFWMTPERALQYWEATYRSIINQRFRAKDKWIFIHYDEILSRRAVPLLEDRLGARADVRMIRSELKRSSLDAPSRPSADKLYHTLLELAEEKYLPSAVAGARSQTVPARYAMPAPADSRRGAS